MVVLTAWAPPSFTDEVSDYKIAAFEKQLRSLEAPLRAELKKKGLAEVDAESVAKQSVDELIRCWKSQADKSDPLSNSVILRLDGRTIVMAATPCIYEFLERAGLPQR